MPRNAALPERELAICRRLLRFRVDQKLSRVAVARELGIPVTTLSNYERAVAPVPYVVADRLCSSFNVHQEWLAYGAGEISGYGELPSEIQAKIAPKALLSAVFNAAIALTPHTAGGAQTSPSPKTYKIRIDTVPPIPTAGIQSAAATRDALIRVFKAVMDGLPPHLVWPYFRHLLAASDDFRKHQADFGEKGELTDVAASGNLADMERLSMPGLLRRLNEATRDRGMKSELARFMDVPLSSISRWLSGERDPGGDATLRLLNWVQRIEDKQKGLGGETNTPKAGPQADRSPHETKTQARKKG